MMVDNAFKASVEGVSKQTAEKNMTRAPRMVRLHRSLRPSKNAQPDLSTPTPVTPKIQLQCKVKSEK